MSIGRLRCRWPDRVALSGQASGSGRNIPVLYNMPHTRDTAHIRREASLCQLARTSTRKYSKDDDDACAATWSGIGSRVAFGPATESSPRLIGSLKYSATFGRSLPMAS